MNSEQKQMKSYKLKSESGEVRRFRIPTEGDQYANLSGIVMSLFDTNSFKLCYTDDEGDRILIESSCELDAALDLMPNLVSLNITISEKEEEGLVGGCGAATGRAFRHGGKGRGGGAFHLGGNGRGGAFRRCGSGRGRGLWAAKVKERLDVTNSKIDNIEARLCVGEEGVMLLWKKKNLECKKSFLMNRLEILKAEGERGGNGQMFRKGFEERYNMVCSKLQILEEFIETEEGSQHEGLLSKKQKFEKKKARMEEKRKAMEERRASMGERNSMGERRGRGAAHRTLRLKWVEASKLQKMKEKESQDGFKPDCREATKTGAE